jgi:hypothetical protein
MAITRRQASRLIGGGACAAGLALSGCGAGGGTAHLRFEVIARARLNGDDYVGFAVNELRARYTPNSLTGFMMGRTLKMEATVVDFGGKADALFVLLQDYLVIIGLLWGVPVAGDADETTIRGLRALKGEKAYPRSNLGIPVLDNLYPKIAAFRDEADPTTVYEVDPDNLANTHGPGAKFLGLSIEIVDPKTPLTEAIQKRLPWIVAGSSDRLVQPFRTADDPTATFGQIISSRSFIQ